MADYTNEISNSVNALLEREGSLMTGNSHLQARDILKGFKEKYLKAIDKGDKSEIQNVKNLTKKMAQGVARWQQIGEQIPDINNNFGWTKGMAEETGAVIAGISSGNFDLNVDDKTGEVTLGVKTGDSKKKQPVTSKQFDDAVSSSVKPLPFIQGILERGSNMFEAGNKGNDEFDYNAIYSENKMKIQAEDSPSIQSLLYDEIIPGQPPIIQHIEKHPALQGLDGQVKKDVLTSLVKGAHNEITSDLLAKAFTEYDQKSFNKGRVAYEEKNKAISEDEQTHDKAGQPAAKRRKTLGERISAIFSGTNNK